MENIAMRQVKDLEPAAKRWLQKLLGRKLREDEEVTVVVRPARTDRLEEVMDRMAEKAKHVPEHELEALIDEAMNHVRRRS